MRSYHFRINRKIITRLSVILLILVSLAPLVIYWLISVDYGHYLAALKSQRFQVMTLYKKLSDENVTPPRYCRIDVVGDGLSAGVAIDFDVYVDVFKRFGAEVTNIQTSFEPETEYFSLYRNPTVHRVDPLNITNYVLSSRITFYVEHVYHPVGTRVSGMNLRHWSPRGVCPECLETNTNPSWFAFSFGRTNPSITCKCKYERWMMVNQDYMPEYVDLTQMDVILSKTYVTTTLLHNLQLGMNPYIVFTKHTSRDMRANTPLGSQDFNRFLHYNRGSVLKNSEVVFRVWARHPEWPKLTFIHPLIHKWLNQYAQGHTPANMILHQGVSTETLFELANSQGVHLCPSTNEGFGHYINEARSCEALIVSTDFPPMNELVSPTVGVLINVTETFTKWSYLGSLYAVVDDHNFEQAIQAVLEMPLEERRRRGKKARALFEYDHQFFTQQVTELVRHGCGP